MMERTDLTQLNKLERYLKENGIQYDRIDQDRPERHQIMVPSRFSWEWDAVCQFGSYGYEDGLLETMGCLVPPDWGDSVQGRLTAEEIIERIKQLEVSKPTIVESETCNKSEATCNKTEEDAVNANNEEEKE